MFLMVIVFYLCNFCFHSGSLNQGERLMYVFCFGVFLNEVKFYAFVSVK